MIQIDIAVFRITFFKNIFRNLFSKMSPCLHVIICQFECTVIARERVRVTWKPRPGAGTTDPGYLTLHRFTQTYTSHRQHSILNTNCQKLVVKIVKEPLVKCKVFPGGSALHHGKGKGYRR